jgi:hypothetical protein
MARITFSLDELLGTLISNQLLPREIVRVRAKGERIHFVIKTNSFILPFIPVSLRYSSFDDGNAVFELSVAGGHLNKAMSWLDRVLRLKMPACVRLEYPNVFVDVDRLLKDRSIEGVRVKDIIFEDGEFAVVTGNV